MEQEPWLCLPSGNHPQKERAGGRPPFITVDATWMYCLGVFSFKQKNTNKMLEGKIMGNPQHSDDYVSSTCHRCSLFY